MLEVLDRSSEYRVALTAVGIAVSLVRSDAEVLGDALMAAAGPLGLKTYQGQIGGNADG